VSHSLTSASLTSSQNVRNLCSGFSYCLSILDTLYVWHGRGSLADERRAALAYAQNLAKTGTSIIELTDGENDDDEMFWMILGNDEYAKADYWQWRRDTAEVDPCIWKVNVEDPDKPVSFCIPFRKESFLYFLRRLSLCCHFQVKPSCKRLCTSSIVYGNFLCSLVWKLEESDKTLSLRSLLLWCVPLYFVVWPTIHFLFQKLSAHVSASRPFDPTVHVLVLPTQLPLDLRLNFRDLDDRDVVSDVKIRRGVLCSSVLYTEPQRYT
jgi:hypothetical protein